MPSQISSHADSAGKLDDNEREVCVTDEVLSSADDAALQKEPSLEAEGPSTDIGAPWLASEPSDEPLRFIDSPFSTKVDYEAWLCMPRADQPAALIRAAAAQESFGNGSSSGKSEELRRHYQACALHEKVRCLVKRLGLPRTPCMRALLYAQLSCPHPHAVSHDATLQLAPGSARDRWRHCRGSDSSGHGHAVCPSLCAKS